MASGTELHVAARIDLQNRGIRVPAGEYKIIELFVAPLQSGHELTIQDQWHVDYSGGAIGKFEITEILGKCEDWPEACTHIEDSNSLWQVI